MAFCLGGGGAALLDQFYADPATLPPAGGGDVLQGRVTQVRDGDTIEVRGVAVRLEGLHAPELDDLGGLAAQRFMERHAFGQTVRCDLSGDSSYDRMIGVCFSAGADIADALVLAGLGRDCPRYSGGRYRSLETTEGRLLELPGYCLR